MIPIRLSTLFKHPIVQTFPPPFPFPMYLSRLERAQKSKTQLRFVFSICIISGIFILFILFFIFEPTRSKQLTTIGRPFHLVYTTKFVELFYFILFFFYYCSLKSVQSSNAPYAVRGHQQLKKKDWKAGNDRATTFALLSFLSFFRPIHKLPC